MSPLVKLNHSDEDLVMRFNIGCELQVFHGTVYILP